MFHEKYNGELRKLAVKLFEINALKFGDFKMKVGISSPIYFDLRVIVSYPVVMNELSTLLVEFMKWHELKVDHVCGVPYTALPIATIISVQTSTSMLIRRKEAKSYGTKKLIEGSFNTNDQCLIIEDVVSSGSSILETVNDLTDVGVKVTDAIVVVDRQQGGKANVEEQHVRMHSLYTLSYLLKLLEEEQKIDSKTVESVAKYIETCQIRTDGSFRNNDNPKVVGE